MDERVDVDPDAKAGSAEELFLVFLKLGLTSFERQQKPQRRFSLGEHVAEDEHPDRIDRRIVGRQFGMPAR